MNPKNVDRAYDEYTALLELEKATGTKTTRARNEILRALNDADLTAVAVKIKKGTELTYGNHARI
jgi:hypothetical protein